MTGIYEILGVPFGFILRFIYDIGIENYAVAIVFLTLFARILMIPSSISQQKGMVKTQRMQAKIRKIQTKYAGNQQKIQEETNALYQREGYNPMGAGCAPMLVQFILLFGLIGAIYYPLSNFLYDSEITKEEIALLTKAVNDLGLAANTKNSHLVELIIIQNINNPGLQNIAGVSQTAYEAIKGINFDFFGLFSLGDVPTSFGLHPIWAIPVLSFLSSMATGLYSQIKQKKNNPAMQSNAVMTGCMTLGMPLFSLYFVINYPAGIGIYWIASSVFGFLSTIIINHFYNPKKMMAKLMVDETVERRSRENSLKLAAERKENKN